MTYLIGPRLHFAGQFQADVSTINNSFDNFDVQKPTQPPPDGPGWNPTGSGSWAFSNCAIGAGVFADGREVTSSAGDPAIGLQLTSNDGYPAKLVDLDTEQQMVSQIFGMTLTLTSSAGVALMSGTFVPAPFTEIWVRPNAQAQSDDRFSATYQSLLSEVTWGDVGASPLLQALQAASQAGLLAIKFNVDGFDDQGGSANFTLGRIVGTIGVADTNEPIHFVLGRQLRPSPVPQSPFAPRTVSYAAGILDPGRNKLILDLGNAFHTDVPGGDIVPPAGMRLIARRPDNSFIDLGTIDTSGSWYTQFAGIWAAPADRALTPQEMSELGGLPIQLVSGDPAGSFTLLASEHPQGLHVRADNFVYRLSPGDTAAVQFVASQFGSALANAQLVTQVQVMGTPASKPSGEAPVGLTAPTGGTTGNDGRLSLDLSAHDLGDDARQHIDGQVYQLAYALDADTAGTGTFGNASDFVSVLVWSAYPQVANPTWWQDVYPIFEQYADLYPYMTGIIDLGNYNSVVARKDAITEVFSLPVEDPHYMPVTRDLSPAKRGMLISWLSNAVPPEGQAPSPADSDGSHGKGAFIARVRPPQPLR